MLNILKSLKEINKIAFKLKYGQTLYFLIFLTNHWNNNTKYILQTNRQERINSHIWLIIQKLYKDKINI